MSFLLKKIPYLFFTLTFFTFKTCSQISESVSGDTATRTYFNAIVIPTYRAIDLTRSNPVSVGTASQTNAPDSNMVFVFDLNQGEYQINAIHYSSYLFNLK